MDSRELTGRFIGTLVGFAVGDALGMPAQFLTRDQIRRYYGKVSGFLSAHPGHASDALAAASYTDDTQMVLATAECLVECGKMDPARQADALVAWYVNAGPRTPTSANVRACKHLAAGRPWNKSGVFSSGCGAAVRMPPIGLMFNNQPDLLVRAALDDCLITHTESRARAASAAVAILVGRLVQATERCSPGDQVLETADRIHDLDQDMAAMLRWVTQIVHLPAEEALFEIGTSSDALEAVPAAVYCFLKHARNYAAAVLSAVNAGDAADSIAALTGSFVGAASGIDTIPKNWASEIENADVLAGVAENLAALSLRQHTQVAAT